MNRIDADWYFRLDLRSDFLFVSHELSWSRGVTSWVSSTSRLSFLIILWSFWKKLQRFFFEFLSFLTYFLFSLQQRVYVENTRCSEFCLSIFFVCLFLCVEESFVYVLYIFVFVDRGIWVVKRKNDRRCFRSRISLEWWREIYTTARIFEWGKFGTMIGKNELNRFSLSCCLFWCGLDFDNIWIVCPTKNVFTVSCRWYLKKKSTKRPLLVRRKYNPKIINLLYDLILNT